MTENELIDCIVKSILDEGQHFQVSSKSGKPCFYRREGNQAVKEETDVELRKYCARKIQENGMALEKAASLRRFINEILYKLQI